MKLDPKLVSLSARSTVWSEAYRGLRTSIEYVQILRNLHTVLVTSAVRESGKSLTAANLAVVMAQAGNRTLVVDADLRRPAQHKIFGLPNLQGYTTVITKGLSLTSCLQAGPVEHLSVLTSGPLPRNPADLLGSEASMYVLGTLKDQFDMTLIDAPPVLGLADALTLGGHTDGVLYIIKSRFNSRRLDLKALQQLRQTGSQVIGAVLNQAKDFDHHPYYDRNG